MSSKHTPGPWDLHVDEDSGEFQINMGDARTRNSGYQVQQRIEVDFSLYPEDGEQWDEAYANMRLIATAPELLEALIEAVSEMAALKESVGYRGNTLSCLAAARGAISKATGEGA